MLGLFFTITDENVSSTLAYAGGLISDLMPLLLPIVGVAVGLFVFWAITSAIKK